jgi:hypothetical protein
MFAINHAASALLFKRPLKDKISFLWILFSVQFIEFIWVALNLLGIEHTTTENSVHYVGDIHLSYMPFSHSLLTSLIISLFAFVAFGIWKHSWRIGLIMGFAFMAHIILDIITHSNDIPLTFSNINFIGLGLYTTSPLIGFFIELSFGLFCWWYFKGNKILFWIILLFNIANISMFLPEITGLEYFMANRPTLIAVVILAQIIITLLLVGWQASDKHTS